MRSPRRRREAVVAALLLMVSPLLGPAAARAAPGAVVSRPPDHAALRTAPAAVELTIEDLPDASRSHVTVWDSAGRSHNSGPLSGGGDTLSQPIRISAAGNYQCVYHIVVADGSDAAGVIAFSVGTGVPPPDAAPHDQAAAAAAEHQHGVDPIGAALLLADVLVAAGVAVLLLRRRPGPPAGGSPKRPWRLTASGDVDQSPAGGAGAAPTCCRSTSPKKPRSVPSSTLSDINGKANSDAA
jgi:methionine-rich copper-binding protein CopC